MPLLHIATSYAINLIETVEKIMTCIIQLKLQSVKKNGGIVNGLLSIQNDRYVLSAGGRLLDDKKAIEIYNELLTQKTFDKNYKLLTATVVEI
jgi:hypothetical protein